jgi:hypothetical protein
VARVLRLRTAKGAPVVDLKLAKQFHVHEALLPDLAKRGARSDLAKAGALRLFFAHADKQDCPWLGMAASVSFVEFKEKVSAALRSGFDPDTVARVFLGGPDPDDAALGVEADEFDETVSAWQFLLEFAAETVLSESFLYNSAKHGLTIVHTDESTQLAFTPPGGGDPVHLLVGSQFAYLHRPENPGRRAERSGGCR